MNKLYKPVVGAILGVFAVAALTVQAQTPPRFLTLSPPDGLPVIPVMEGWVAEEDGGRTLVFGYINRNDNAVDVPLGEDNYMEPAEFNGLQPTHFGAGRGSQVFTVRLPADRADEDVWWYVRSNGELLKVPGRATANAYELDFERPRPQGALQPWLGMGEDSSPVAGLHAWTREFPETVRAGEEVTLTINTIDPSERDSSDPRFEEPLDIGIHWAKHQGPGEVEFIRHPSTEVPENPYEEDDPRFGRFSEPEPSDSEVKGGAGVSRVNAIFSEPGEYLIRVTAENWSAPDSSRGDQCCASNAYIEVRVNP